MNSLAILALFSLSLVSTGFCGSLAPPRDAGTLNTLKRTEELDPRYTVDWEADLDAKTIEFTVRVQTTGYVGFGLSVAGTMNGADIVIGGVANGSPYFDDYHGVPNNAPPVRDESQDWHLISASEAGGFTTLTFNRTWDTCDDKDEPITVGTIKLIWSIGNSDTISRHEPTNRGARAVNILDPALPPVNLDWFDRENVTMKYTLQPNDTVYWCKVQKRIPTDGVSQIVAFKPILDTPQALKHTHHFNMYTCRGENAEELEKYLDDRGVLCSDMPSAVRMDCQSNLYAWSFGGRLLVFPDDIGFPWGDKAVEYYMFEAHFDNPALDKDLVIDTGVEIYHTKETRPKKAGMLSIGHGTSPSLMIPPRTGDWTLVGHCSPSCSGDNIKPADPAYKGIWAFNANLHAHKSGKKMKLRHFRAGKELPWIANDYTYDFDFQENRPLQPVEILPGDHLSIECTYDSSWRPAGEAVIGGPATQDEMCMVFIFYYPKVPLEACFSNYNTTKFLNRFGVEEFSWGYNPTIQKPDKWAGLKWTEFLTNNVSWTEAMKAELVREMRYGAHDDMCHRLDAKKFGYDGVPLQGLSALASVTYPEFDKEYVEPLTCLGEGGAAGLMAHAAFVTILALVSQYVF